MTALAWTLLTLCAFAFALAVQMRMMIAISLRRALAAKFGGEARDPAYLKAIRTAGRQLADTDHARHLEAIYPRPLSHLTLARRASAVLPFVLSGLVIIGRFGLGVF